MPSTAFSKAKFKDHISNDAALKQLTEFLDNSVLPDSVSHQLQRLQRDLRGLPPPTEMVSHQPEME